MTILAPIYIGKTIDSTIPFIKENLITEIIKLLLIYVVLFISNLLLNKALIKFATKTSKALRADLFKKTNKLTLKYLDKNPYGDTLNRFTVDVENVSNGLIQSVSKITMGIITVIISIIIMIKINKVMTVILICIAPIMYIISRFVGRNTTKLFSKRAEKISDINGYTEEALTGFKTIKNFNSEQYFENNFKNKNESLKNVGIKSQFYSSLTNPSTRFVSNLAYIVVAISGIMIIKSTAGAHFSIGNLTTFLVYTNVFTRPFNEITSIISEIQTAIASAKRIFDYLNEKEEPQNSKIVQLDKIEGRVEFKNVYFSYVNNKKFIEKFNLIANPKQNIAIVGKTGAGKTTIVNLLMRFYEINSGEITIDGVNIQNISKEFLRKNIGIVLQDTKLFTGTIKENISYGSPNATDEEIKQAAKMAYAHEFIERLPEGYNTYIKNQNMLSPGEIQLINIARVMLTKPPIIILDEATSNIDIVTENKISNAFNKLIKNSTSFIIAHRLSTIKNADKIIFIENGNIIEEGTHEQLLAKKGKYYSMYETGI
jgi:ATP-binding cassette subfamily B multidrug efflux pump